MLLGILYLILFQLLGHLTVQGLGWPIPSPVMGLVFLFAFLVLRGSVPESLYKVSGVLLPLLPLFLIPASAGIVEHGALLQEDGVAIAIALVVSLVVSVMGGPFLFQFFIRLFGRQR